MLKPNVPRGPRSMFLIISVFYLSAITQIYLISLWLVLHPRREHLMIKLAHVQVKGD